jgi:hypothetical protein
MYKIYTHMPIEAFLKWKFSQFSEHKENKNMCYNFIVLLLVFFVFFYSSTFSLNMVRILLFAWVPSVVFFSFVFFRSKKANIKMHYSFTPYDKAEIYKYSETGSKFMKSSNIKKILITNFDGLVYILQG